MNKTPKPPELQPCAHCGRAAVYDNVGRDMEYAACSNHECGVRTKPAKTKEIAAERWNKRNQNANVEPPPDFKALAARVEGIRNQMDKPLMNISELVRQNQAMFGGKSGDNVLSLAEQFLRHAVGKYNDSKVKSKP